MSTDPGRDLPPDLYLLSNTDIYLIVLTVRTLRTVWSVSNVSKLRNYSEIIVLGMFGKSAY